MTAPRIRDFLSFMTTLPASMLITVCLFLPHTKNCQKQVQTPFEAGTWIAIVPIVVLGVLPLVWRVVPRIRKALPELLLAFAMIVMALFVVTIPVAIYLMWGYSKKQFRGELLAAMCSTSLVMMWLFAYPFITLFDHWLPAADTTWVAALVECVGLMMWTSAAASRPVTEAHDESKLIHWAL